LAVGPDGVNNSRLNNLNNQAVQNKKYYITRKSRIGMKRIS